MRVAQWVDDILKVVGNTWTRDKQDSGGWQKIKAAEFVGANFCRQAMILAFLFVKCGFQLRLLLCLLLRRHLRLTVTDTVQYHIGHAFIISQSTSIVEELNKVIQIPVAVTAQHQAGHRLVLSLIYLILQKGMCFATASSVAHDFTLA